MNESERHQRPKIVSSLFYIANYLGNWPITFKLMVASQPDSLAAGISRNCICMMLEDKTASDILTFVDLELKRMVTNLPPLLNENFSFLQERLIEKRKGVFLWTKLVLELEQK